MSESTPTIRVEVAYATVEKQLIKALRLPEGSTVREAALASGLEDDFPGLDVASAKLGVFSKLVTKPDQQTLRDGDRVEIYRPLLIDPKQARANRAKKVKPADKDSNA